MTSKHYSHSLLPEGWNNNISSNSKVPMNSPTIASAELNNEEHNKISIIASEYDRVERLFNPSAATSTAATTPKKFPFHHVLLVGGSNNNSLSKTINDDDIDDYLSRRHEFQKKVISQQQTAVATKIKTDDDNTGTVVVDHTNAGKDGLMNLREMSSQLEMAMITCCERVIIPTEDVVHRSRIIPVQHVPILPANWGDDDNVLPVVIKKLEEHSSSKEPSSSSSSSSPRNNNKAALLAATNKMGILRIDKSMHFVKLLVMNCYDINHRALAIAILQRTIQLEISTIDHPQINKNTIPKLFIVTSTDNDDDHVEQRIINTIGLLNTELKQSFSLNAKRTKSFLAAGGMRLLAQWLVDSYTVVLAPSNPVNPIKGGGTVAQQQQQQQQGNVQHIASPTGCLLLPLLHLLKFIPFDKKVVIESQIHKYIKRLKKSLSAVVEGFHSSNTTATTLDNNTVHPIAGGLSVRKVITSIDTVMSVWKRAAASPSIDDDHPTSSLIFNNTFDELQKRVKHRFDYLEQMQSKAGNPAWYMGKSIDSSVRSFTPNSVTTNNKLEFLRQNSLPVAVKSMEEDKQGVSKKREGSPTVFESSKNPNKKHISWAPLPIKGED